MAAKNPTLLAFLPDCKTWYGVDDKNKATSFTRDEVKTQAEGSGIIVTDDESKAGWVIYPSEWVSRDSNNRLVATDQCTDANFNKWAARNGIITLNQLNHTTSTALEAANTKNVIAELVDKGHSNSIIRHPLDVPHGSIQPTVMGRMVSMGNHVTGFHQSKHRGKKVMSKKKISKKKKSKKKASKKRKPKKPIKKISRKSSKKVVRKAPRRKKRAQTAVSWW